MKHRALILLAFLIQPNLFYAAERSALAAEELERTLETEAKLKHGAESLTFEKALAERVKQLGPYFGPISSPEIQIGILTKQIENSKNAWEAGDRVGSYINSMSPVAGYFYNLLNNEAEIDRFAKQIMEKFKVSYTDALLALHTHTSFLMYRRLAAQAHPIGAVEDPFGRDLFPGIEGLFSDENYIEDANRRARYAEKDVNGRDPEASEKKAARIQLARWWLSNNRAFVRKFGHAYLERALQSGSSPEVIKFLIRLGVDVNEPVGMPLLEGALQAMNQNTPAILEILIKAGTKVEKDGLIELRWAYSSRNDASISALEVLINHGLLERIDSASLLNIMSFLEERTTSYGIDPLLDIFKTKNDVLLNYLLARESRPWDTSIPVVENPVLDQLPKLVPHEQGPQTSARLKQMYKDLRQKETELNQIKKRINSMERNRQTARLQPALDRFDLILNAAQKNYEPKLAQFKQLSARYVQEMKQHYSPFIAAVRLNPVATGLITASIATLGATGIFLGLVFGLPQQKKKKQK